MERDGKDIPLVTDLDGTLVAGDTLVEGVKDLLARSTSTVSYTHLTLPTTSRV